MSGFNCLVYISKIMAFQLNFRCVSENFRKTFEDLSRTSEAQPV